MADQQQEEIRQLLQERMENINSYTPEEQQTIRDAASRFLGDTGGGGGTTSKSAMDYVKSFGGGVLDSLKGAVSGNTMVPGVEHGQPLLYKPGTGSGMFSYRNLDWDAMSKQPVPDKFEDVKAMLKLAKEDPAKAAGQVFPAVVMGGLYGGGALDNATIPGVSASGLMDGAGTFWDLLDDLGLRKAIGRKVPYLKNALQIKDLIDETRYRASPDATTQVALKKYLTKEAEGQAALDKLKSAPVSDPYNNPPAADPAIPSQSYVAPGPRATQGVGAGPELNAGIRYQPPVEQELPNLPLTDPYNNPPIQDPHAALKQEIADIMFSSGRGVGAGPELAPGIKSSPVTQPRVTSAAKKVAARSLDSYTNPTNPNDPYSRPPAPVVEAPPRAQGVGAGTMEYESLVNVVSKRLNLPSAEQAGEIPATSGTAGTGSGPTLPKDLTSLAEKMLAQREVKASVLAKYFKDAKIPVEEVDRLARESPTELKTHAKNAGYPRGISPESLDVVLRKLRAIQ